MHDYKIVYTYQSGSSPDCTLIQRQSLQDCVAYACRRMKAEEDSPDPIILAEIFKDESTVPYASLDLESVHYLGEPEY